MKIFLFSIIQRNIPAAVVIALCLVMVHTLMADVQDKAAQADTINITSDQLVIDNNTSSAEFSGNVKAKQGDTEVTSEKMVLHYRQSGSDRTENNPDNIEKILFQGHVRIVFDNRVAVTEEAVYTTSDRKLILTGPGSTITSEKNVITGSTIIFDRNTGKHIFKGDDTDQVKAVIHSGQRGLN